ncbi:hypothetical protein PI172_0594 [Prevotella intermedia]|uniref:DUF4878 domain-containing protein n=1 Tax=Prevotella intermedia TaxID=28131 RepID=A0AAD1BFE3_PREIN|nr:hypothetical protein [Prevotella intermedia]AFJ09182.1 lumazine-binding domain protein [Prevotella intermedia 17]APW34923.1 hypothetical protein BWX40_08855 [Prevotella intermedia]BAR95322.1 hypothetical protein PI172_0594 [Prevotella intermedia]
MKQLLYALFLAVLLLSSCSKKKETDHGAIAAEAAKHYYENLISGKYKQFLEGMNLPDKLPESYERQMLENFKAFAKRQDKQRKGIKKVSIRNVKFFAKDSTASAFLLLHYGDSTTEEVVVPMLKRRGLWYMR